MRHRTSAATFLIMAVVFLGSIACNQQSGPQRTVFTVEGMHCDACSTSIVTTLEKVEGVEGALADWESGVAEAIYRPNKVDPETLKVEIEKLGYTVMGMESAAVEG